ncbi:PREDICTED: uncharacterized protein LOC109581181 [Amphimedon queenslandica]|nr:PREDICTED: uncharacterized protein LOC109581181 [Amphimedon queenslandica]|eukprot:XP_019850599.1 PREDICTED: uncharacterized protein LOC109581181 [Amphimedon queenslandica]
MIGLVWCFVRHTNELGAKDIAAFCDVSCLPPEEYPFPSTRKILHRILYCGKKERLLERYQPKPLVETQKEQLSMVEEISPSQIENNAKPNQTEEEEENKEPLCCPYFTGFWNGLKQIFIPRIHTDLDFLVARLFYADSGHGQVFKDIQIQKELNDKISQDHELLYLLNSVHSHLLKKRIKRKLAYRRKGIPMPEDKEWERLKDLKKYFFESKFGETNPEEKVYSFFKKDLGVRSTDWSHSPLRSVLFGFLKFAPDNKLALDISFGNRTGHSLILARAFYQSVTIHFNTYYKNPKEICREDIYQANFRTFTYQADIFSQNASKITESEQLIIRLFNEDIDGRQIDLIVIGPMTDRSKIVTTNLLIEKMYGRGVYFREGAILLAMRPLMIGSKSCTGRFIQYEPPEGLFDNIGNEVNDYLAESNVPVYSVSSTGAVKKIEHASQYYNRQGSRSTLRRRHTLSRLMSRKEEVLPCGLAIECNKIQCLYEFRVFRYKAQEEDPLAIIPEEQPNNDINEGDILSSGRDDVTSHSSVPPPIATKEESVNDIESGFGGDVATGKLVSPIQSPTSMPNLTLPSPIPRNVSKSHPNL